jgi:hypothetical protein
MTKNIEEFSTMISHLAKKASILCLLPRECGNPEARDLLLRYAISLNRHKQST